MKTQSTSLTEALLEARRKLGVAVHNAGVGTIEVSSELASDIMDDLAEAEHAITRLRRSVDDLTGEATTRQRRINAYKGQITKLKKRLEELQ